MGASVASADIESSYYPSAKVRLIVRFEEFGSTAVQGAAPKVPTTVLRGVSPPRAPLVVGADPASPPGVKRLLLTPAGGSSSPGGPQAQTSSSDGLTFEVAGIIPRKATLELNGVRAADTMTMRIRWVDCPLDPRTIRSCGVEYYLGCVDADAYALGVAGNTRTATSGSTNYQEPLNVIPDSFVDASGATRSNLRFQGFVDVWDVESAGDTEALITLECRDNTQLLIDVEAPAGLTIGAADPIDKAIAAYLANFPNFAGFSIEYRPSSGTPPVLASALAGTAFQPKLGPAPARGGGATTKLSVWDYLTDVCGSVGHVVYVDGTVVVIQQPLTLYASPTAGGTSGRPDDPFVVGGGRTVDGESFANRRLVFGRNVFRQKIRRNFQKNAPAGVEVRCYSPRRKKDLVVRFPDPTAQKALVPAKALPGNAVDQKWTVWKVRGIEDPATLLVVAKSVYQNGRNEFAVELETHNLATFGGDNADPDALDMKAGDAFDVLIAQDPDSGDLGEVEQQLIAQTNDYMQGLAFDPGLAAAYAKAYVAQGFQTTFRVKTMALDWDADAGEEPAVKIAVTGINYVEVRLDQPVTSS